MSGQPTGGKAQAKQALKDTLTQKAKPAWGNAAATIALVKSAQASPVVVQQPPPAQAPPQAQPPVQQETVRLTNAARNHYKDVKRANENENTSEVGVLPHNDAGLIALVNAHWGDFEEDGGEWTLELGSFRTSTQHWGIADRRWMVIATYVDDGATFLVKHYGPTGSG